MKYEVTHRRFFMNIDGKMTHIPKGSSIEMDEPSKRVLEMVKPFDASTAKKEFVVNPAQTEDKERKSFLLDEIEKLSGSRPGNRSGVESLEKQYSELTEAE